MDQRDKISEKSKKEKKMKVLKKAGTAVVSVILWAVILVAALYAFTTMATRDNQNVANLLGYTPMAVQTPWRRPLTKGI